MSAAILVTILNVFTVFFVMEGPRYSDFWMGGLGHGDGMGLIGMMYFGAVAACVSLAIVVLTAIIGVVRKIILKGKGSA
ncbi:MAG: hypothetical protein ABL882_06155 [Sphingopyxis sp.]